MSWCFELFHFYFAWWLNTILACLSKRKESIVLWSSVLFEARAMVWKTVRVRYFRQKILLRKTTNKFYRISFKKTSEFLSLTRFVTFHYCQSECCSSVAHSVQQLQAHPSVPLLFPLWFSRILFLQHCLKLYEDL